MTNFNLIEEINQNTNNKYKYLKLKQVYFDEDKNMCKISIIYPSFLDLTDVDKDEIIIQIKKILKLKECLYVIKINKSFVEEDLIKQELLKFIQKLSPLFYGEIIENIYFDENQKNDKQHLKIEIKQQKNIEDENILFNVYINFYVEKNLVDYFYYYKLDKKLIENLGKCFCANFFICANEKDKHLIGLNCKDNNVKQEDNIFKDVSCLEENEEKEVCDENFLSKRIETLKTQSDINALIEQNQDKYSVFDKKIIIGNEINFNPRFINSIKEPMENCVVAGKINFLTERTYKSKRKKKNKQTGEEEQIVKPYFNFSLQDKTSQIGIVIFPSKANYHKMHLLKNGDKVIVRGKVERYNDKFEIMAKSISLCEIPINNDNSFTKINLEQLKDYRFVKPIKYTSSKQSNIFDNGKNTLSREASTQSFVVYDFETTGINPEKDEIIEIGALKIVNGFYTEVFTCLVKPKNKIPLEATKINRITNEMVLNCHSIEQVIGDFYLFCKDCQMVGYNNIAFDSLFLNKASKSVDLNFSNGQIDAFLLAKQKIKGVKNYKLSTISKYLEVNLIDAHRALNDVVATAEVFLKLY